MTTALRKYQRLEATGLWRAEPQAQRREVIVALGNATMVISDLQDRALAHWSLPALVRTNPDQWPAIYHPDGDPGETLELARDEAEMVAAIEKLRQAISRRRPHPGRLRWLLSGVSALAALAAGLFWLPGALVDHTVSVLPEVKQREIATALLGQVEHVTGPHCDDPQALAAVARLSSRLSAVTPEDLQIVVVRDFRADTAMLPGQILLLNSRLLEDHEEPDVAAGYVLAEVLRAENRDPLRVLLEQSGLWSGLKLLGTGAIDAPVLRRHAEDLLSTTAAPVAADPLLQAFRIAEVKSTPYAYALDVSGESSLALIEADPFPGPAPRPVLSDADWLRLQAICET